MGSFRFWWVRLMILILLKTVRNSGKFYRNFSLLGVFSLVFSRKKSDFVVYFLSAMAAGGEEEILPRPTVCEPGCGRELSSHSSLKRHQQSCSSYAKSRDLEWTPATESSVFPWAHSVLFHWLLLLFFSTALPSAANRVTSWSPFSAPDGSESLTEERFPSRKDEFSSPFAVENGKVFWFITVCSIFFPFSKIHQMQIRITSVLLFSQKFTSALHFLHGDFSPQNFQQYSRLS